MKYVGGMQLIHISVCTIHREGYMPIIPASIGPCAYNGGSVHTLDVPHSIPTSPAAGPDKDHWVWMLRDHIPGKVGMEILVHGLHAGFFYLDPVHGL